MLALLKCFADDSDYATAILIQSLLRGMAWDLRMGPLFTQCIEAVRNHLLLLVMLSMVCFCVSHSVYSNQTSLLWNLFRGITFHCSPHPPHTCTPVVYLTRYRGTEGPWMNRTVVMILYCNQLRSAPLRTASDIVCSWLLTIKLKALWKLYGNIRECTNCKQFWPGISPYEYQPISYTPLIY